MTRHRLPVLLVAALAIAGCDATDSIESTEPAPDPTTTTTLPAETTTTAPLETTTTAPVETTTTVAETTTTLPAETTTTTAPSSLTWPEPAPAPPAIAYATNDTDLLAVDVASGAVTAILVEFFNGDGVFRGNLRLSPDGTTIWFAEGYEDGWYGCETSVGSFGRVDVATAAVEIVGVGTSPDSSPDGTRVAYLDAGQCLPDPEAPDFWVLTPYDRVVVRDLASGGERAIVSQPAPADPSAPSQVTWAGFTAAGGLLVLTADGQLRSVDLAGSEVLQDHPVVVEALRGSPVGAVGERLITVDYGDEGSADVYATDLATGESARIATSEGFVTAGIATNGAIVVTGFTDVSVEPGAPVTVLAPPPDGAYYDLDW